MNEPIGASPLLGQASSRLSAAATRPHRQQMPRRGRWWAMTLLVLVAAGIGAAWWSTHRTAAVHYLTVPATRGPIARAVTATGTVNPELTIIVGSYVSGVIEQLYCDYNTQVKAGQICAKIDPRPYQVVVNQAKANLAEAKAQLEKDIANLAYTKSSYQRDLSLSQRQYVSQDVVDNAKNLYDQAQAQIGLDHASIEQRQAELDAANVNLGYTDIVSPVDGTVVSRNVTQGQTVASSFQTPTLFLIATDLTRMEVDTNVSESDIGGVKEGDNATFTVDAFPSRVFQGTVTQVRQSPQTVQNVVTFDAVVGVDNHDLALKPGMTASTRITVDHRDDVVRVPNQALHYAPSGGLAGTGPSVLPMEQGTKPQASAGVGDGIRLWVLRDGQPVPLSVVPGLYDENFTEIVKGDLRPGEDVIVSEGRRPNGNP